MKAVEAARSSVDACGARCRELAALVDEVAADIGHRRDQLPGLAEDAQAFRDAMAALVTEENRERILKSVLIPKAAEDLAVARSTLDQAACALARVNALAALEQMFEVDNDLLSKLSALQAAVEASIAIRNDLRPVIANLQAGISYGILDINLLVPFTPKTLRAFFLELESHTRNYVADEDVRVFFRSRFGLPEWQGS